MSVSTTQRLLLKDSSSKTCRASWAAFFGPKPGAGGPEVGLDGGLQGRLHDPTHSCTGCGTGHRALVVVCSDSRLPSEAVEADCRPSEHEVAVSVD
jgi:hypothetical protein